MKMLTLEDRKELERMWSENAAPVKVAATLDISLCTVYAELKRGQAIDSEGEVVLDKNFRPAYSAERGETMYQRNLRNRGRRVEIKPEYRKMAQDRICTTQIEYEQLMM